MIVPADKGSRIVIVGGGTAGWMAAALLSRFTNRQIVLIESDAIGTVGVGEATIPQIRHFNAALGLDESEFLRETRGSYKLGIEFAGWSGEGSSYMHAFGQIGHGARLLPFHHYWLRAKAEGNADDLSAYSLNERAARQNKMHVGPQKAGEPPLDMPWAYHFDAGLYAAYLRRYAESNGATRVEGKVGDVALRGESGLITSVKLEDGRAFAGDFFIDCSGFRGLLIQGALSAGLDDWTRWLPCDRAVAVPCATKGDFTPYTKSTAHRAGWQWRIPLQHRIGNGVVYSSAHMSAEDAEEHLLGNLDSEPEADPNHLQFTTGMRSQQWVGNCLALGLSAGFMEPLESTSIHLIQSSLARFVQMLHDGLGNPAIRAEFNRQARFEWSRIRDFLILHYWANGRQGEPFWDACRTMDLPDTLTAKIEQFRASGYIHREHEELFTEQGWLQVLIGQGVEPQGYNLLADTMPQQELTAMLDQIAARHASAVAAMPDHIQFLRARCMPPQPRKMA